MIKAAPNYLCDLHCHTDRSDGCDSPLQLIHRASEMGMKIIAVTDHDTVPPQSVTWNNEELNIVRYAETCGVKLVRGTEISCDTFVDDVHVLGYGCRWEDPFFSEMEAFVIRTKMDGYQKFIQRLNELNMMISWEDVISYSQNNIQKKLIFELMAKKGYFESWREAKMWVNGNPNLEIRREKPDPHDVIRAIHKSGGIAVLAHPHLINEQVSPNGRPISRDAYMQGLISSGLDGIEANYTYDKTSYKGQLTKEQIFQEVTAKYAHAVGVLTGGSDFHADEKKGTENPRQLGECGIDPEYFYTNSLLKGL